MTDRVYKKKVLALMSGGVDSSVAAALLCAQGYEVAGVYLKLYESRNTTELETEHHGIGDPCWAQEMRDAAQVAAKLGIPLQVWDVTAEYKARVLQNFYSEYAAGRTPNPDVLCNSEIKFGVGLERALAAGYDFVATGHYARIHNPSQPPLILRGGDRAEPPLKLRGGEGELCQLYTAVDQNKDQSYFLWRLTQEQLRHVLFPIGEYTKPQVRALARQFGLHNWNKKDSQGVCFLGKIELKEFLYGVEDGPPLTPPRGGGEIAKQFPPLTKGRLGGVRKTGPIIDVHGTLLGFHDGLAHFTIGQRHGTKLGGTGPYFVVEKDMARNVLIVAHESEEQKYRTFRCQVSGVRWIGERPPDGARLMARTRYRAQLTSLEYYHISEYASMEQKFHSSKYGTFCRVTFAEPQRAVAPGQSIVFYEGERVVGGGVIDAVRLLNEPRANSKFQAPKHKEIPSTKTQITKVWDLKFRIYL
ncbi:tRNA-specific 2-thiouridylase [Candidatus Uhrbacteria bacterium]|nr:tRNA-specific 2-thiouridylase [Candidatus Uhrbacteria bacterium]